MLTEEDKKRRVGRVTSSTVAAALGRSERNSRLQGYCWITGEPYRKRAQEALGLEVTGSEDEDEGRARYFQRGDDLEPLVLRWGAQTLGCEMERAQFVTRDTEWSGDSTDALYTDRKTGEVYLAEGKTVSPRESEKWGKEMTSAIPPDYRDQCRWHLLHHEGVDICYVPWIGGYDFGYHLHLVERDADKERELWEQAHEFWKQHVQPRVPPPVSDLDTEYLTAKWPRDNGKSCEPTEEMDELVEIHCKWRDRRDLADKRYREASNQLRAALKEYASVECDRYKISYRASKDSTRVEWEALARSLGASDVQILEHTVTGPGARRLLVTGRGDLKKKKDVK